MSDLAQRLRDARVTGKTVDVADEARPRTVDVAYSVQARIVELAGTAVAGYKIGATAQPVMDMMGLNEPFWGPLLERFVHEPGSDVPIVPAHRAGIETEFVVGLGADLPPREEPYALEDAESVVAWVSPGFELVGFPYRERGYSFAGPE